MTIKELREKRKKTWDTARDFLDSKRNANGVLSEEDSKTYDAMEQTIVDLGKEIQRLERQAEIEAEMNKATSTPVLGKPATPTVSEKTGTASDACPNVSSEREYCCSSSIHTASPLEVTIGILRSPLEVLMTVAI